MNQREPWSQQLLRLFGAGDTWTRPLRPRRALTIDAMTAALFTGYAYISLDTTRSLGTLETSSLPRAWQYVWLAIPCLSLIFRRMAPLAVLAVAIVHLAVTASFFPELSPIFAIQVYYFFALFTAVAWAAQRRLLLLLMAVFVMVVCAWIFGDFVLRDDLAALAGQQEMGPFPPLLAAVLQTLLSVGTFLFSSTVAGVLSWQAARRQARTREQAETIATQAEELSERAVVHERLRIARELHDVVGHHVSVMGIQTAAARRVLERDPEQATQAMLQVERSARSASGDLRLMLGTLRTREEGEEQASQSHVGLSALPGLAATFGGLGLEVTCAIEGNPDDVPPAIGLSLFRVAQEALTNVQRHSTADRAELVLQVRSSVSGDGEVELTVRDDGTPKEGTSGSGLGLVGMRERAELLGGQLVAGPRESGGFEVKARISWTEEG